MNNIVERIFEVSDKITNAGMIRNPSAILTKSMEEMGELSTEVGILYHGFYKAPGNDGLVGEACDVINCIIDLIHVTHPEVTADDLFKIINKKLIKWEEKTIGNKEMQEAFDKIVTHLLIQGGASTTIGGEIVMRGINGSKCSIGVLISDEFYSDNLKCLSWDSSLVQDALKKSGYNLDSEFLCSMQNMHDDNAGVIHQKTWRTAILVDSKNIAEKYNLVWDYDYSDWV